MKGELHIKKCTICNEIKELSEFYSYEKSSKTKGQYTYYYPYCKECSVKKATYHSNKDRDEYLEYQRQYSKEYMNNPFRREYHRQILRERTINGKNSEYYMENKEKFKMYANNHRHHDITKQEWEACKEYFNNACAYCGLHEDNHYMVYAGEQLKSDLHKEHVDHEGTNDLSNCVPACKICNVTKWQFKLEEWYNKESNEYYSDERIQKIYKWLNGDYKLDSNKIIK